jgi:hypothetical protein
MRGTTRRPAIPAHAILGEAMRVFYENPGIPQTYLMPI